MSEHDQHQSHEHEDHQQHHQTMIADFRRRLWVSLALIVPILLLSHLIQGFLGLADLLAFPADDYGLRAVSTAVFVYGGWPFLIELVSELRDGAPGMMTLIPSRPARPMAWASCSVPPSAPH